MNDADKFACSRCAFSAKFDYFGQTPPFAKNLVHLLNTVASKHSVTGDATTSFLSSAVPKETKLPEDNNTTSDIVDGVGTSQPQSLSLSSSDTLAVHPISSTEKTKKKKTKTKKQLEKVEVSSGGTCDGVSETELDSASVQLPVASTDDSNSSGKRSKKIRNGHIVRSEDVDGYCGSLPVDDLIEFIDCGRKLWRNRSQPDAQSLTETEKLQSSKKESVKDAAVENDSGFGDTEIPDQADGALSPSVCSVAESVENVAEMLSDSLNAAIDESATDIPEEKLIGGVSEVPGNVPNEWTVDSEFSFAVAFLSDEEFAKPEQEFIVVKQKKRRGKNQKVVPAKDSLSINKTGGPVSSQNSSVACSSASSERSNSPQSVATVNDVTINRVVDRQVSDSQGNTSGNQTSSFRRYNSEPKWRARQARYHSLPNTELHSVRSQKIAFGSPSSRMRLTTTGGKYVPFATSLQQKQVDNMKGGKCKLSAGNPQLPDVVPSAERPRQADKACLSSVAKVVMQDAHCQTMDDTFSQYRDEDSSIDTSQTPVQFDLLTLQLFMYHAFEDVMNTSRSFPDGIRFYSSEVTSSSEADGR